MSTWGGGLSVIDTKGTITPIDDELVVTYTTATTPAIGNNYVRRSSLQNDLLYVSTNSGLSVIDTKGTTDSADDTLVTTYTTTSTPAIGNNSTTHSFLDSFTRLLYVSTYSGGLSVIDLDEEYASPASYQSSVKKISDTPTDLLSFSRTQSDDQSTAIRYRTGDSGAVFFNDFDDDSTSEYLGDFYAWGNPFNDAVESGGTMRLSDPTPYAAGDRRDVYFWLDTGKPDGYFPIGSVVTARVRVNSDREQPTDGSMDWMYNDDWWDDSDGSFLPNNEWQIMKFTADSRAFSKIGFEIVWKDGTWNNATDSFEIDWIKIETPDSLGHWSSWSSPCTANTSCPIDPSDLMGKDWIQYRLDLATDDPSSTPSVDSVTWSDGYASSGTYLSEELSFPDTNDLLSFASDTDIPTGTSIAYEYTIDGGTTWENIDANHTFPSHFKANRFQWRATLASTDPLATPVIHSVTLSTTQSDLNAFSNETKELELENGGIVLSRDNFTDEKTPELGATNPKARNGEVAIYIKGKEGSSKKIKTVSVDGNGYWKTKLPKGKEGKYSYAIRYTDQAGNVTGKSKYFTILRDFTDPVFEKTLPSQLSLSRGQRIDFPATDALSGIDTYKVKLEDAQGRTVRGWRKQGDSFYVIPGTLPSGRYTLSVKVLDKAENTAAQAVSVRVW